MVPDRGATKLCKHRSWVRDTHHLPVHPRGVAWWCVVGQHLYLRDRLRRWWLHGSGNFPITSFTGARTALLRTEPSVPRVPDRGASGEAKHRFPGPGHLYPSPGCIYRGGPPDEADPEIADDESVT
jgi:hypothetical protein